jgi:hypothetical protein
VTGMDIQVEVSCHEVNPLNDQKWQLSHHQAWQTPWVPSIRAFPHRAIQTGSNCVSDDQRSRDPNEVARSLLKWHTHLCSSRRRHLDWTACRAGGLQRAKTQCSWQRAAWPCEDYALLAPILGACVCQESAPGEHLGWFLSQLRTDTIVPSKAGMPRRSRTTCNLMTLAGCTSPDLTGPSPTALRGPIPAVGGYPKQRITQ